MAEDTAKKGPGGRDISDLKARLGLNKGPAGAQPAAARAPTPSPGVPRVPAPTPPAPAAVARPVPAPPGFPAPASAPAPFAAPAPAVVDPRRDPFAAAAAPAAPAFYGYAPLPGVDDGQPAAAISKPKPWGKIATVVGIALVPVVIGFVVGRIYTARVTTNLTIDQAADIRTEVQKMSKSLGTIVDLINSSPDAAKGNPDVALAAKLGELELKKPDTEKLFRNFYTYALKDLAIDRLFTYYNDTITLYSLIATHARKTDADKDAIADFAKAHASKGDKNYGVTLDLSGPIPLAHVVEIGGPVCPKEGQTDCSANDLKGFKFRTDSGGSWSVRPVKGSPATVIYPIQQTPLFATISSGSPEIVAARDHVRRMAEIRLLTQKLFNEQKELLTDLDAAANQPKVNPAVIF